MIKVAIIGGNQGIKESLREHLMRQAGLASEEIDLCDKENLKQESDICIIDVDELYNDKVPSLLSILNEEMLSDLKKVYCPEDLKKIEYDYSRVKTNRKDIKKNNYNVNQKIKNYKR